MLNFFPLILSFKHCDQDLFWLVSVLWWTKHVTTTLIATLHFGTTAT